MTEHMSLEEYKKKVKRQGRVKGKPKKIFYDGHEFPSQAEVDVYIEFKFDPDWQILEVHPKLELQPKFKRNGKTYQSIDWTADLKVMDLKAKKVYIIEVKSKGTYRANSKSHPMRRKLFLYHYPNYSLREIVVDGKKRIQKNYP